MHEERRWRGCFIEVVPTELALLPHLRLDTVYRIFCRGAPCLLHIEFQKRYDAHMPNRVRQYVDLLQLWYEQHYHEVLPVLTIVIWVDHLSFVPPTEFRQEIGGTVTKYLRYEQILLYDLDWHTADVALLALAPFMHGITHDDLEPVALKLYQEAAPQERVVLLAGFLTLADAQFSDFAAIKVRILQQIGETMSTLYEKIAQSDFGQMIRADGIKEGRQEAELELFLEVWQDRFGKVTAGVRAAAARATSEQRKKIIKTLATDPAYTVAQARRALGMKA